MPGRNVAPLPTDAGYTAAVEELVTRVNGFVYAGDRLSAVLETVRELRADPDLARKLIGGPDVEVQGGTSW